MGLYLVEKAEEEIKNINQKALLQKALIKKNSLDKLTENSLRTRKYFVDIYNRFLNNSLSSTLLKVKENFLKFKNSLLKELKIDLINNIEKNIRKSYQNYKNFLINKLSGITPIIVKTKENIILLNSNDYDFIKNNFNKLPDSLKNNANFKISDEKIIGGFKALLDNGKISYDFTIDNVINKNSILIEKEFSTIFNESKVKDLEQNFENFIKDKRSGIEEYLKEYDRV